MANGVASLAGSYPGLEIVLRDSGELNITDREKVEEVLGSSRFHYCINCAAYTAVDRAEKEPAQAFAVNAEGVRNLAIVCKETHTTLVHLSTDYVFDGKQKDGYRPGDTPNPINEYGRSKLLGEEHIQKLLKAYFIVRTSWLYDTSGRNFYTNILEKAGKGEPLRVTDAQRGCPTRVATVAKYVLDLIHSGSTDYGIHHVTDGEPMTWYDFAERILEENGLRNRVRLVRDKNYRSFAPRPANSVLLTN